MADVRIRSGNVNVVRRADGNFVDQRGTRDGAAYFAPWMQALVFEGKVYVFNVGTITTPIAGHATIDADQPEMAVRIPSGTDLDLLPLYARVAIETGSTTLSAHGAMIAVSNIDVANGTSTASNSGSVVLRNARMDNSSLGKTTCRHTYSGNGTDPLTTGNFIELARIPALLDSDAATSGFHIPPLLWSAQDCPAPVVSAPGSLLGYWEGSTSAMAYGTLYWAEFSAGELIK